ncbi:hypothetical protein TNCV_3695031 [Trichonephila clavipes]|nr:hypothetical protein TNCV_3695031 [Trichonephila clavipes]
MGYNDLRDIAPVLQGMHAYMDRVFMQCFLNPFRCTQLYSKNRPRSNLARLQELWWKQATEDLANEEAKWVKLKDKKKLRTESAKGIEDSVLNRQKYNFYFVYRV